MTERFRFVPPKQAPKGLWRRVPPIIFMSIMGMLGLALAWRSGVAHLAAPSGLSGFLDGIAVALFLFSVTAYICKIVRRPAVLAEECLTLPGRVGIASAVVCVYLAAGVFAAHMPGLGRVILVLGLLGQAGLIAADLWQIIAQRKAGQAGMRSQGRLRPGPDWQLKWSGVLVAANIALILGWPGLANLLLWPGVAMTLMIALLSLWQLLRERFPRQMYVLLTLHVVPAAAFGMVVQQLGLPFQHVVLVLVLIGVMAMPWLIVLGRGGIFLSALCYPVSAAAQFFILQYAASPGGLFFRLSAVLMLVVATLVTIPLTFFTMRDWARGRLAIRSNSAIA
ncbi:MAG: hypothetical protein ACK5II_03615 [Paracoccus sp. (in: a-proteobacteria)]